MILPIHATLRTRIHAVLLELYGLNPEKLPDITIQYPPNRTLGDLAITIAFELARTLRKAPKIIAAEIVDTLGPIEGVTHTKAMANGYVNVFLNRPWFLRRAFTASHSVMPVKSSVKAIVEHTAINPNKAAHIGHLRNSTLGDTLSRVLRFLSIPVEVQNYIDDTGVQVADVVVGFRELEGKTLSAIKEIAAQPRFDYYCWDLYARVTEWYASDPSRLAHRTHALKDLEDGGNDTAAVGRFVADQIVQCHLATMARLNVEYDLLSWEGDILRLKFWARAFEILKDFGAIFFQNTGPQSGCWVMPLDTPSDQPDDTNESSNDDHDGDSEPRTKVIVRSNGTVTYVGKDIAYQFWKFGVLDRDFHYRRHSRQRSGHLLWSTSVSPAPNDPTPPPFGNAGAVYNVIDTRQAYLQQLLKQALTTTNRPDEAKRSVHVSYEMVALSHATAKILGYTADADEGRPFVEVSGRKGLGVKADDLLNRLTAAALTEVTKRHANLSAADADRIATAIAIAAVRYFMIKYSRGKLITFDIDDALSFEGESGPYIQYAVVRATNILRKLRNKDGTNEAALVESLTGLPSDPLMDPDGTELWGLVLEAARLDEVAEQSSRTLELSMLAKYTFRLAQMFNTFYHSSPVINEERRDVRLWRATAISYCRLQLTQALDLMGCEVPPRM